MASKAKRKSHPKPPRRSDAPPKPRAGKKWVEVDSYDRDEELRKIAAFAKASDLRSKLSRELESDIDVRIRHWGQRLEAYIVAFNRRMDQVIEEFRFEVIKAGSHARVAAANSARAEEASREMLLGTLSEARRRVVKRLYPGLSGRK